jgi:1-acyl-sn-glycerol-3-phosphate acyltransferase
MLFQIVYRLARWIAAAALAALGGLRVEGREHLPVSGGVILAANHVSYLDAPVVAFGVPRPLWYLAKEALFRIPVLGSVLRFFRAFPVRPHTPDRGALRQAEEILNTGGMLLIFPEGSCSRDGELLPFRPGAAMIALHPTAILGTEYVLPPDVYRPRCLRGGMVVRFGVPIDPADLPPGLEHKEQIDALMERVETAVRELLGCNRELARRV